MTNFFSSKFKLLIPLLTLLLTLPAVAFLFRPGMYYNMHDDMQMIRQLEFDKCLHDGQIPCRWTPELGYGYGYPLFNFYPPLPYIVGQVFRTFSFDFMDSVKLMAATQIILASAFMYILAASLFGRVGGLLSALFYTYAPYHAVNVYVRGAFNEAWASVFFPLNLYFAKKLIETKKAVYLLGLAFSFAMTMLSHNPMVLTFAPILVIWSVFWLIATYRRDFKKMIQPIIKLSLSALLAIALAAFFFLPVIFETGLVKINSMFEGYYHFSVHFTSIRQLFFSNYWGNGASVWGQEDNMSFMIGYLHWIVPILLSLVSLFRIIKRQSHKLDYLILLISFLGFFTAFMTHERSAFLWLILTPIQKIQFPWRFLNHTIFLLSLTVGFLPYLLAKGIKKNLFTGEIISVLVIALLTLNLKYFTPLEYGPLTDAQKFSGKAWINLVTSGIYDYLPKTASIAPQRAANFPIDDQDPKNSVEILSYKQGTDWFLINLDAKNNAKLTLAQLYFPDFRVEVDNQNQPIIVEPEFGRMVITITPGQHQVYVKLHNTPIRSIGNIISLFAWIFFVVYLLIHLWPRQPVSKSKK